MRSIVLIASFLLPLGVYSQSESALHQVDSLVKLINNADFTIQRDTIKQDHPEVGLSIRTYLTMVSTSNELKKYVNNVHMTTQENGASKQMITTNTFYFNCNRLIKVEESATEGDTKLELLWYYADDKPIYYTLKSDKAQARAELLLVMAKVMVKKINHQTAN